MPRQRVQALTSASHSTSRDRKVARGTRPKRSPASAIRLRRLWQGTATVRAALRYAAVALGSARRARSEEGEEGEEGEEPPLVLELALQRRPSHQLGPMRQRLLHLR